MEYCFDVTWRQMQFFAKFYQFWQKLLINFQYLSNSYCIDFSFNQFRKAQITNSWSGVFHNYNDWIFMRARNTAKMTNYWNYIAIWNYLQNLRFLHWSFLRNLIIKTQPMQLQKTPDYIRVVWTFLNWLTLKLMP